MYVQLCINGFHDLKKNLVFVFVLNLYKEVYISVVLVDFLRYTNKCM